MDIYSELRYYKLLAEKFPTKRDVLSEIINLQAIVNLPKGTEHFISDLHGEHEHFIHIMRTASGVIRAKIDDIYGESLPNIEKIKLANLIYYPEKMLKISNGSKEWYKTTLQRLIDVCKITSTKYTRSKVRKALPQKFAYIIDELLNCDGKHINKEHYYNEIIESIISLDCADDFIIEMANVINRLSVDHLHIVGDIFDRGERPDIIIDYLMNFHSIDIQWGNHDVLWMGAMMGSDVCAAIAVSNSLRYKNLEFLEEGYGISLRPLFEFAQKYYSGKDDIEKMYKAISIIRFKIEDSLMKSVKVFDMTEMTRLDKINFDDFSWCGYKLNSSEFPTIDPENPLILTEEEKMVIEGIKNGFLHSEKAQKHLKFLFSKGSIYLSYNNNLLYHGSVPLDENGEFLKVSFDGKSFSGKSYLEYCEKQLRKAYSNDDKAALSFVWYLWCGTNSPLFGKNKMTTFERMYIDDKKAHIEEKQPYFEYQNKEETCNKILCEFGIDPTSGHIINGHIPIKYKKGESPIKANGKLIVIDGGMAKSYFEDTGIAGYTLIFNSYGLVLTSHMPFEGVEKVVSDNVEITSSRRVVENVDKRIMVADTDTGRRLIENINELKTLLYLYNTKVISEK